MAKIQQSQGNVSTALIENGSPFLQTYSMQPDANTR